MSEREVERVALLLHENDPEGAGGPPPMTRDLLAALALAVTVATYYALLLAWVTA